MSKRTELAIIGDLKERCVDVDRAPGLVGDTNIGNILSGYFGDTGIDTSQTPLVQWEKIVKILRLHGLNINLEITERKEWSV